MALDPIVSQTKVGYAVYPSVFVYELKTEVASGKKILTKGKQLLFGDRISIKHVDGQPVVHTIGKKSYVSIRARNTDGFVLDSDIQPDRILEVNFIDVGQGDGCHIVTPDDKHFLIDAGPGDNMYRFLRWRFNLKNANTPPPPFTVIVSHSDSDHYEGFRYIFKSDDNTRQQFTIDKVYHNGLVELNGNSINTLGRVIQSDGIDYITDLCDDQAGFQQRADSSLKGNYVSILSQTSASKESLRLGSPPVYDSNGLKIEVLGPVAQLIEGKAALPVFKIDKGKTKNGHSIILKLTMGRVKMLLGGDLNEPAEDYLMKHYTNVDIASLRKQLANPEAGPEAVLQIRMQLLLAVEQARKVLQVDVAKSCHHGSSDFTSEFMQAVNPLATIISSGDNEPHVHPRPDTLGTIGKHSRGERSLIFSTELARSSKEFVELALKKKDDKVKTRVVTVYGMINVRTDGQRMIIAQRLERKAARGDWDIHQFVWNPAKDEIEYQIK
ncbi:hypothetical protein [Xanthocytophaga agilis]|uniref:Metallo-beta-lactamase domain-containing protein n=1 Tax=Xanthocytophaga agilis TaxID=3048010 RepID=A0AAE3UGS0_9BACT|nr:hypothetical protein [Xanthocytophaga agilis]MDJ1503596.1 hypothetical protein [Xanthocytophaga agilis]